jgi:divalent metal cation (Fe/Co/Zn/Cd) transporter
MKYSKVHTQDKFEKTALKITGYSFYLLTIGLIAASTLNLINGAKPHSTLAGIIISSISIVTMYWLMKSKLSVGRQLKSDAIIADANCTKTCFYLSFILLAASLLYELFGIGFVDILGSLGIAYYAFKEGKESLDKAKTGSLTCCDDDCETE